jgi:hypothetical protein
MTIEIWLIIALTVSITVNIFLFWFSREQSTRMIYVSENLDDLVYILTNYREHLKKIYTLDMFYGDETLGFLMEHTKAVAEILDTQYSNVTNITDPLEVDLDEENEEETKKEQDVFYAGTREGNT